MTVEENVRNTLAPRVIMKYMVIICIRKVYIVFSFSNNAMKESNSD